MSRVAFISQSYKILIDCCYNIVTPPPAQIHRADVPQRPERAPAGVHAQHRRAAGGVRVARPDHALLPHAVLPPLLQVRLLPAP